MKVLFLNKDNLHKYSKNNEIFESIFENDGLGLSLSYSIYKSKIDNEEVKFSEFLNNFFIDKKENLPHFIEPEIYLYRLGKEKPEIISSKEIFNQLYDSGVTLRTIIGESGSGKTTAFLSLVYQCYINNKDLSKIFSCCYISINNNHKTVEDTLSYSLNIEKENLEEYLLNTYSTVFFIDLNSISKTIEKDNKQYSMRLDNIDNEKLLYLIDSIKETLEITNKKANKNHRLFIMYRAKKEYLDKDSSKLHNYLNTHSYIYEIRGIQKEKISEYISKISGYKGKELLTKINSISLLKIPLFVDIINWLSIKMESSLKNYKILSLAHLYLIFTREFFRYKPLKKQWQNKEIFQWVEEKRKDIFELKEKEYSEIYNNNTLYKLEKYPHVLELLLMIISLKLGNNFYKIHLIDLIDDLLSNKDKYIWLNKYIDNENKPLYKQIIENTIFRIGNGKELELLHHSFSDYYYAKSFFYDLEKGILVNLENKKHYENVLNNCTNFQIIQYFIKLFELLFQDKYKNISDFLESLNLKYRTYFYIAKSFDENNDIDNTIKWYKKTLETNPKNFLASNNLGLIYKDIKDYNNAIEMFELSIKLNSKFEFPFYNLANLYKDLKDYNKAEEFYLKYIELVPLDHNVNLELAILYSLKEDEEKAVELIENYHSKTKNKNRYYYDYFEIYKILNNYEKMIFYLEKGLKDNDVNEYYKDIYIGALSDIYRKKGNIEKSNEYENQKKEDFFSCIKNIMNSNDIEYIKQKIIILENKYSDHEFFFNNVGLVYLNKINDIEKAEYYFIKAIEDEKSILDIKQVALCNLGYVYFLKENFNKSLEYYNKSYQLGFRGDLIYSGLIATYLNLRILDKAEYYINEAIIKYSENPSVLYTISYYFYCIDNFYKSLKYLKKIIEILEKNDFKFSNEDFLYTEDIITFFKDKELFIKEIYYLIANNYIKLFSEEKKYEYFNLAEEYYLKALKIYEKKEFDYYINLELSYLYNLYDEISNSMKQLKKSNT